MSPVCLNEVIKDCPGANSGSRPDNSIFKQLYLTGSQSYKQV